MKQTPARISGLAILHAVGLLMTTSVGLSSAYAGPIAMPTPGEYQVDQETTTRDTAGATVLELIVRTDGATGNQTHTRRAEPTGSDVSTTYSGQGPITACVRLGQPPITPHCITSMPIQTNGATSYATQCNGLRQEDQWYQLDDKTWEHRFKVSPDTHPSAALPAETAKAMAPVIAALEEATRSASREEAEAARQQLTALKGRQAMPIGRTTTVVERWLRTSNTCKTLP